MPDIPGRHGAVGVGVVAQGVETPAQAQTLQEFGCHLMQGYHFARPMPAAQITERLNGERLARSA